MAEWELSLGNGTRAKNRAIHWEDMTCDEALEMARAKFEFLRKMPGMAKEAMMWRGLTDYFLWLKKMRKKYKSKATHAIWNPFA